MENLEPVAIVTDSAAGLPESLLQEYAIEVVPYWVQVGPRSFLDGVDITPAEFFRLARAQAEPDVGTSVPSASVFLEVYRRVAARAKAIVSIHLAGTQSATCNVAELAAQSSPIPVTVIDTATTAMAEGFVVLEAARAAVEGAPLADVVARARALVPKVELIALLENVNYVIRGGRLASAARLVSGLLNIQLLVRVGSNKVGLLGQVRRRGRGLSQLVERVKAQVGDSPARVAVHFTEVEEEAQELLSQLKAAVNCVETYLTRVPVALGVHAGPGSIGVAYCAEAGFATSEGPDWRGGLSRLQGQAKELLDNVRLPGSKEEDTR